MIETIRPGIDARHAKIVLFDFDGTLSLIRSGWVDIMVPMMVEVLADLKTGESEAELTEIVREYVGRLTGKDTIYQMIELTEQVSQRGGTPEEPLVYKKRYLDLLWDMIRDRVEALRSGNASPEQYLLPGTRALLDMLKDRGLKMYLASGTDHADMNEEARLLDVARYFDGGCWGATTTRPSPRRFSSAASSMPLRLVARSFSASAMALLKSRTSSRWAVSPLALLRMNRSASSSTPGNGTVWSMWALTTSCPTTWRCRR
jgi:phosphoglycolate phosphatase-like HAD superfamily hydrolase